MRVTGKEKIVVLAVRGVLLRDKKKLYEIARDEGLNSLSALLRREIKKLIKAQRKAG